MPVSSFLLVLWVFLVATVTELAWFSVDNRLIGFVGLAFVIVWVIEAVRGPWHVGPHRNV